MAGHLPSVLKDLGSIPSAIFKKYKHYTREHEQKNTHTCIYVVSALTEEKIIEEASSSFAWKSWRQEHVVSSSKDADTHCNL